MLQRTGTIQGTVDLWYADAGAPGDPCVLLLHGAGGDVLAWSDDFVGALVESGFRVVRFDQRDTGLSGDADDLNYTIEDLAADAIVLLGGLGVMSVHAVGHSMGGMVAQQLAIDAPLRVRSLALLATSPDVSIAPPDPDYLDFLFASQKAAADEWLETAVESARRQNGTRWPFDEERVRSVARSMIERAWRPEASVRHLMAVYRSEPRTEKLSRVTVPTLVVHGSEDPLLPQAHGRALAKAIRGARLEIVAGWGHIVPWGHWDVILNVLLPHLAASEQQAVAERDRPRRPVWSP